jgi:hypothetical protein
MNLTCDVFHFRGKIHKHTVIAYCEKKVKEAKVNESQVDLEGFVLLWEFLILLLRQNGVSGFRLESFKFFQFQCIFSILLDYRVLLEAMLPSF